MAVIGIMLCAGSAERMGFHKLLTPLCGRTAIERSMEALVDGGVERFVCAVSESTESFVQSLDPGVPVMTVRGGSHRGASVLNALEAAGANADDIAVIHDAARCLVRPETVRATIESAIKTGSGIAAVPLRDSVLRVLEDGVTPVDRAGLWRMQTPQTFRFYEILSAYHTAADTATDDSTIYRMAGHTPTLVEADEDNFKLTTPADWVRAERMLTRYGTGFDTHVLAEGRRLILGGVEIPFEKGLVGHSDADVLVHAVMDAILGAAALPDIGHLFPDNDPAYEGADSMKLLGVVMERIREKGFRVGSIDATIIAQRPKMAPYIDAMRANLAAACGISIDQVGVKATTTEHMNDEGRGLCISAQAIATVL